jgi:outer membrane protease
MLYFAKRTLLDIPKDLKTYTEWVNRFRFFYALCRGVVSEIFVNNWVNGSLFAFPIQTKIKYDNNNQAIIDDESYCNDLIYFDKSTNNFYYRSSHTIGVVINLLEGLGIMRMLKTYCSLLQ